MSGSRPFTSATLDPTLHDLSRFHCGEQDLDVWLREHAATSARARVAQTFVWVVSSGVVVAYYALTAHAVQRVEAPSRISRGVPDPVPAALIAELALDSGLHGQGLGGVLLADALQRIITAAEAGPAVRAIGVDASTERGRSLHSRFGFVASPGRDDRMMARAETVAKALG